MDSLSPGVVVFCIGANAPPFPWWFILSPSPPQPNTDSGRSLLHFRSILEPEAEPEAIKKRHGQLGKLRDSGFYMS